MLGLAALLCFTWVAGTTLRAWRIQIDAADLLDRALRAPVPEAAAHELPDLVGRLEIPRIGLQVMVLRGSDRTILDVAAGHVDGTAWPGDAGGHAALAGHRDTFFRPLKDIAVGDAVRFTGRDGVRQYRVTALRIVDPADVHVLDASLGPMLSLVTCYPLTYIGRAPLRLVVQARPLDFGSRATEGTAVTAGTLTPAPDPRPLAP